MSDFDSYRGDDFKINVVVRDANTGASVNVAGWTFWFTVKRYYADSDRLAVFQAKTGDGSGCVTITDATSGKVACTLPALKTVGFPDGPVRLLYDVQAKDPFDVVTTIDSGTITVRPDVTRTT